MFNSRAKTKKFSRHVFTNADQVIFRTKRKTTPAFSVDR
nr:DUF1661 domain-containing protein [Porphyromonas gingivalis]